MKENDTEQELTAEKVARSRKQGKSRKEAR